MFSVNERFVFSDNPIVGTTSGGLSLGVSGVRIGTLFCNSVDADNTLTVAGNTILNGSNNSFGNKSRYTLDDGTIVDPANTVPNVSYVIDHLTGLAWYTTRWINLTWDNACLAATNESFIDTTAGQTYTDFFLPSISQLNSVKTSSSSADFIVTTTRGWKLWSDGSRDCWTPQIWPDLSTFAFQAQPDGRIDRVLRTSTLSAGCFCRVHFK